MNYLHVPEVIPPVQPIEEQKSKRKYKAASHIYSHGLVDGRVGPATMVCWIKAMHNKTHYLMVILSQASGISKQN